VQDRFGNLWIATGFGGVSRYDGKTFTTYTEREGLPSNTVFGIIRDGQENLWFATQLGASRFDGRTFTNYALPGWLPDDILLEVIEDRQGNLWFAMTTGVSRLNVRRNEFTHFRVEQGLRDNLINGIFADSRGIIWISNQQHGLTSLTNSPAEAETFTFRHYSQQQGLPATNILALAEGPDHTLWIGSDKGAIQFTLPTTGQAGSFRHFTTQNGLSHNEVNVVFPDKQGRILFGTGNGVSIYEAPHATQRGRFTYLTEADGLLNPSILSLVEDKLGTLWIGTEGGLSAYRVSPFTFLTADEGFPNERIYAILEDRHGTFWLGTGGDGLFQYRPPQPGQNGTISQYTTRQGLSDDVISTLHEDRRGRIWIATRNGGVTLYTPAGQGKPATFTHYTEQQGLLSNFVASMLEDHAGNLWFGQLSEIKGGLTRFDGQTFTNFARKQGLNSRNCWSIAQDKRGTFWLGTWGNGFTRYEPNVGGPNGRFTHFDQQSGLSNNKVRPILVDTHGAIWLGTIGGGVCQYEEATATKPARFAQFTEREGLTNNDVRSILEDRRGNLWFGNYYGISRFSPSENRFVNFTQEDGFLGTGCVTNAIYEDRTGKIWLGTQKNLTILDPARIRQDTTVPTVQLTDVRLFNEQTHWQTDTTFELRNGIRISDLRFRQRSRWYGIAEGLSLSHAHNFLAFSFVGININTPQTVWYQYQLAGLDETWSSPTNRSEASYGNLPPGNYTFLVRARNGEGAWSQAFQYAFQIRSPWWASWWAYMFYGLLIISIVYAIIQYRVRQGLERIRALEAIRTRISSDLHDDVGSILSGLAMQSQMLALTAQPDQKTPLNEISDMSHEAMDRMRDTVWAIDSRKDKYENLIDRMRAFAEKNLNLRQITHDFEVSVDDPRQFIDPQTRQNVYLIFREAISNSCKHSDATHVSIRFRQSKGGLDLLIHDNGSDKQTTVNSDGLGLRNMQLRAAQMGGTCVALYENGFKVELILGK
jgi:ligand-binding sensor domain-containing protein/two-component sensor histidine kinase